MTERQVRALLRRRCRELGGQPTFAARHRLSQQYVSEVCRGHRAPGKRISAALGLRKIVTWEVK